MAGGAGSGSVAVGAAGNDDEPAEGGDSTQVIML